MSLQDQDRAKRSNPAVVVMLGGILAALLVLIVITLRSGASPSIPERRIEVVADHDRVRGTLQKGRTYRVTLKAGIEGRVEDKAYAIKKVVNMAYLAECVVSRKIVDNDGARIIEERTFVSCRTLKAESHVQDIKLEWGLPGELSLAGLDYLAPGAGRVVQLSKPLLERVILSGAESSVNSQVQTWAKLDGLSGKTVRIVFENGKGVLGIEDIRGTLTESERQFLTHSALLSDYFILPDLNAKPNERWEVDAYQLSSLIDPSLRGIPRGTVTFMREPDAALRDKKFANLRIESGTIELDDSDNRTQQVGSFSPRGRMRFNLSDTFVDDAELTGRIKVERVSKDHLLFETTMRTEPHLRIQYKCVLE